MTTTPVLDGQWADVKLTGTTAGQAADHIADGRPGVWTFKTDQGQLLARNSKVPKEPGPLELIDITDHPPDLDDPSDSDGPSDGDSDS